MSLYAEDDKMLWIGTTRNGVFKFDGKIISHEKSLEILRGAVVRDIDGAKESGIWFATEGTEFVPGLCILRRVARCDTTE